MIEKRVNENLKLSSVILGSCYFGTEISEEESFKMLDRYYELGGRTVDTARVYASWLDGGESASEKTIGKWLKSRKLQKEITVVTKGGHPPIGDMLSSRLDRDSIFYDIERSLKALDIPKIDLYLLHRDNLSEPIPQIMQTLNELIKMGYVNNIGVSNWTCERIAEANIFAEQNGLEKISVSQIQWSLAKTTPEAERDMTLVCMNDKEYKGYLNNQLPIMAFSSQSKGFFSKYLNGEELNPKILERFYTDENLKRAKRVGELANKYSVSPSAIVLSYIYSNNLNGTAIVGCSKLSQLEDSMMNSNFILTDDDINFLTDGEGF